MEKRILAVDLGTKRIGLAITDPLNIIAQPFKTIEFKGLKNLSIELNALISEMNIGIIVFGLPVTLSGNDSKKTKEVRELVAKLREIIDKSIKFEFEDEALTSVEAHKIIHQMGKKPSKNKALVDQIAAQRILQSYMGF
jgi:putative holliday junction resolvase